MKQRRSARAFVVDRFDRVLMLRGCDPHRPEAGQWLYTPGGGVEESETLVEALRRELREEIGLMVDDVGDVVHQDTSEFEFDQHQWCQQNWFFLIRVDIHEADLSALSADERRGLLSAHWFTLPELDATDEVIYPEGLTTLVADLLARPTT